MANKYSTLTSLFTAIADAIRGRTGGTDTIVADDFPDAIAAIEANKSVASILEGCQKKMEYATIYNNVNGTVFSVNGKIKLVNFGCCLFEPNSGAVVDNTHHWSYVTIEATFPSESSVNLNITSAGTGEASAYLTIYYEAE